MDPPWEAELLRCLNEYPHLVLRLRWLPEQVGQRWGEAAATSMELVLDDGPESDEPSLVVLAHAEDTTPEGNVDRVVSLYQSRFEAFGPWPDGVGFEFRMADGAA